MEQFLSISKDIQSHRIFLPEEMQERLFRHMGGGGTRLASTVIGTSENVCPRFMPEEFGLSV